MHKTVIPALLFFVTALGACSQRDLGRYCFVGAEGGENANDMPLTILNPEAPECIERLCLKQGGYSCSEDQAMCADADRSKLQAMCTLECDANKDCKKTPDNVNDCSKYVCQKQGQETGFGDRCICVCLDFIRDVDERPITEDEFNQNTDYSPCSPK